MTEKINRTDAEKVLLSAFKAKCSEVDNISKKIGGVLNGSHKTYKYVLINGLLAKATNNNINPLALQAGAPIKGAYDARSLCHKVLVPFERTFLQNALGGSNEPFLNKPARFTHLSDKNAVRSGNDKNTLDNLIQIFNSIKNSEQARHYLACAFLELNKRIKELSKHNNSEIEYNPTLVEVYEFICKFLEQSFEGESSAIIIGTLEKLYHNQFSKNITVKTHKVNQSGASSKEVGDIDIFIENKFHYAIEVKDKDFTSYDLEHAFNKIITAKGDKGQFIYGVNASFDRVNIENRIIEFEKQGFLVLFQDILNYSKTMIFKTGIENKQKFVDCLFSTAIEVNSKDELRVWIQKILSDLKWK